MKLFFLVLLLLTNVSFSQITVNERRIVLDRNKANSHSVIISNGHQEYPFLSQIWIEDKEGKQIDFPIVALPFLQRTEPGRSYQVKISTIGDESALAQDRETLFYFNLMGVPPKSARGESEKAGIQFLIQYRLKLFYRPKGLKQYMQYSNEWVQDAKITRSKNKIIINNPSQYHLNIGQYGEKGEKLKDVDLLIEPFGEGVIQSKLGRSITLKYISDKGKLIEKSYICEKINEFCQ